MSLQDPEFDSFKRAYKEGNFNYALHSLKKLLATYPQSVALRWHHARVLEKLERFLEARVAVNKVLRERPDFVPALIMQVQLDFHQNVEEGQQTNDFDDEPVMTEQARFNLIEQRLYKILSIDPNAVDALHMLSGLLRGHEGNAHLAKADQLLNRAISLAPDRVDLLEDRANSLLASAVDLSQGHPDSDKVTIASGTSFRRRNLELALSDFQHCYQLKPEHRYGLRVASLLHDLGRFREALTAYDDVLARVAEDDPYRSLIVERRALSEHEEAEQRERIAQHEEAARGQQTGEPNGNKVEQASLEAVDAADDGQSLDEIDEHFSEDTDEAMVNRFASQILQLASESHPDLVEVNAEDFPVFQQKFIATCKRELSALGFQHVCNAEAQGLRSEFGQPVLMGFFADDSGETGITCFCTKPQKINPFRRLLMLITGRWKTLGSASKVTRMVECVCQFANGDHLGTQYQDGSPFSYDSPIHLEKLPLGTSIATLVNRHGERLAEYRTMFPHATTLRALDLSGIEHRWLKTQAAKRQYRKQLGYVTDVELQELLGDRHNKFARKVRSKVTLLADG